MQMGTQHYLVSALELVRVDNCTAWRPMSGVMDAISRVVHPNDVK